MVENQGLISRTSSWFYLLFIKTRIIIDFFQHSCWYLLLKGWFLKRVLIQKGNLSKQDKSRSY